MTVTVHLLLVPTQRDPLVVHVIILPAEMAELAIYLQVTRNIYSVTITCSYSLVIDAPCADLDCLNSALLSIFIEV